MTIPWGLLAALLVTGAVLIVLVRTVSGRARWQARARAAEKTHQTTRRAHDLQERVARDSRLRKRVRRYFERT